MPFASSRKVAARCIGRRTRLTTTCRAHNRAAAAASWRSRGSTRASFRFAATRRIVYQEQPLQGDVSPGDVLSVRITVAGSSDWRYLIVEDPLPAGVEAVQDTTAYPMEREDRWRWWWGSQTEYRDNRTVFFQERFDDGRVEYVYLVKAISSGDFRAAPAQVAPMYVTGRGGIVRAAFGSA